MTKQRDMYDALRDMEDPITSIKRGSDTLEMVALNDDLGEMPRNALVFVADSPAHSSQETRDRPRRGIHAIEGKPED